MKGCRLVPIIEGMIYDRNARIRHDSHTVCPFLDNRTVTPLHSVVADPFRFRESLLQLDSFSLIGQLPVGSQFPIK
jgi:hypothetical protein